MTAQVFFTPTGVRLRQRSRSFGDLNWLLLPGGPGLGSESLHELADALNVPGSIWMVDLPGDGSNGDPPGAPPDPFSCWPMVLVEAAQALPNAIYVGHSTGGMYLLSTPTVEQHIVGLALVSAAPDARWRARFTQMTRRHPLPAVDAATAVYEHERTPAAMREIAIASAAWSFTTQSLDAGRNLLRRLPYNGLAVTWSAHNFDETYTAAWWPRAIPTLIVSGADDRIVWQGAWEEPAFRGNNVMHRTIQNGAHFPWIENPHSVRHAFGELAAKVVGRSTDGSTSWKSS